MNRLKLSEICNINAGGTPARSKKEYWNHGKIPWCKISDFSGKYIEKVEENITEEGLNNSSAKLFKKGTILYTIFATIGEVAILNIESTTNQAIAGIEIKNNGVELEYLYYFLKSLKYIMLNKSRGVAQNNINLSILRNTEIYIPDKTIQKAIAEKLDNVEKIIYKKNEQLKELNNLIKSQFVEMFGDPFENKNNYKFITFDNFMERCVDIGSNGANKTVVEHLDMKDTEDYALLVRTLNFTSNDFKNNVKYISKDAYEFFSKSKVFGGEIIFNKIGSAGINFLMPNLQRPVSLGLNQIMVTPKEINTRYLYDFLNTEYGKHQINSRVNGAVTKSIQKTELKKIPIMYPPMELQKRYSDFAEQIDKQKFEIENSLKEMQELYECLMEKYFG